MARKPPKLDVASAVAAARRRREGHGRRVGARLALILALSLGLACSRAPVPAPSAAAELPSYAAPDGVGAHSSEAVPTAKLDAAAANPDAAAAHSNRGFPIAGPWLSFYGTAKAMGELSKAAANFAILNVDADPAIGNFTPGELAQLRKGGANRVLSYLNLGACEQFRSYWAQAPAGLLPCKANKAAQLGPYAGYPNEVWMNPANQAWRALILQHIAPRLVAQGIDGFYLDNLELVEHGPTDGNGPCDAACRQGGLGLVAALRAHYPQLLLVMQNATSAVTRQAVVDGVKFASLLDGVAREQALWPGDVAVQQELAAWQALGLQPGGRPFWVGTLDYVGHCGAKAAAEQVFAKAKAAGLSPYVTDKSGGQQVVCYW